MTWLLATWLWVCPTGSAQEMPETAQAVDQSADLRARLEVAKGQYFAGGHAQALSSLDALLAEMDPRDFLALSIEAWVYRGEIQYVTGDRAGSWSSFLQVLDLDPEYQISTFLHPAEVVDWFDLVSRDVSTRRDDPPPPNLPPVRPPPVWTLAPFGVPQLGQQQRGRGVAWGVAQGVTGGASIGLHLGLRRWKRNLAERGIERGDPRLRPSTTVQWGVQVPVTAAFYGMYLSSVVSGRRRWKEQERGRVDVSLWADPTANTVGVAGAW